jgi:hypothetical protein
VPRLKARPRKAHGEDIREPGGAPRDRGGFEEGVSAFEKGWHREDFPSSLSVGRGLFVFFRAGPRFPAQKNAKTGSGLSGEKIFPP